MALFGKDKEKKTTAPEPLPVPVTALAVSPIPVALPPAVEPKKERTKMAGPLTDALVNTMNEVDRFTRKVKAVQAAMEQTAVEGAKLGSGSTELRACKRSITDLKNELKILWKALS